MAPLHFVFPPSMGSARGEARLELIGESVRAELGHEVGLEVAPSYDELATLALSGRADLVWAPPVIAARLLPHARAVFQSVRHGVVGYHAALIARRDTPLSLETLRGTTVAWVGKSSLAGYRLPRDLLRRRGLDPDRLFRKELFVGAYPEVLSHIAHGDADVGGICVNVPSEAGLEETVEQYGGAALRGKMRTLAISDRVTADCILLMARMPATAAEVIGEAIDSNCRGRVGSAFCMGLEADRFVRLDATEREALALLAHL
ncbi:MAG: hypothetical protein CMN30_26505 [Sandaracinus sp.]|nr:hypothetical protein [Sandaracinus sp.]